MSEENQRIEDKKMGGARTDALVAAPVGAVAR